MKKEELEKLISEEKDEVKKAEYEGQLKKLDNVSVDDLHAAADIGKASDKPLEDEDDDDLENLETFENLDDLFIDEDEEEETDEEREERETEEARVKALEEETEEEKEEREKAEEEEALKLEEEKNLEPTADQLRIRELEKKLLETEMKKKPASEVDKSVLDDTEEVLTVGKLREVMATMQNEDFSKKEAYQNDYVLSFYKAGIDDGLTRVEVDEVFDFLRLPENAKFDSVNSESGAMDGALNFHKVMRAFEKRDKKKPLGKRNVKKELLHHGDDKIKDKKNKGKKVDISKLDKFSKHLIERSGMSSEDVAEALAKPSSVHTRGGRPI